MLLAAPAVELAWLQRVSLVALVVELAWLQHLLVVGRVWLQGLLLAVLVVGLVWLQGLLFVAVAVAQLDAEKLLVAGLVLLAFEQQDLVLLMAVSVEPDAPALVQQVLQLDSLVVGLLDVGLFLAVELVPTLVELVLPPQLGQVPVVESERFEDVQEHPLDLPGVLESPAVGPDSDQLVSVGFVSAAVDLN